MTDQVFKDMDRYWGANDMTFDLTATIKVPLTVEAASYADALDYGMDHVQDIVDLPDDAEITIGA